MPSLNFAMYPVTLVVSSDKREFCISSQTDNWVDSVFPKPVGPRGAFRYMFNDYPVANVRFAEEEARATRLYSADFGDPNYLNGERTLILSQGSDSLRAGRSVARVKVLATGGNVRRLDLLDKGGGLIKTVEYEYGGGADEGLLRRQTMRLPERPLTVGFSGKGIRVKIGDETQTYNELDILYHQGSRECVVTYEPTRIGSSQIALPTNIGVQDVAHKNTIHSAHLANLKAGPSEPNEIHRLAREFGQFAPEMLRCRQMAAKYWLKGSSDIGEADRDALKELEARFDHPKGEQEVAGKELRRTNMLLQTDWMLGDMTRLSKDFDAYLDLLSSSGLQEMVLTGGESVIETTALWGYSQAADKLQAKWVERCMSVCSDESVLRFAYEQSLRGRFWTCGELAKGLTEHGPRRAQVGFEAQALRCTSLYNLHKLLQGAENLRGDFDIAQAGWVSYSMDSERLLASARESLAKARGAYQALRAPTEAQEAIRSQLDALAPMITPKEE
jgi:hypothetical protein